MKKKIYVILLTILLIPILVTNVFAETLYFEGKIADMEKIENSKYKASGVTTVRNADGELMSVGRVDATRYLNDPITDKFLNADPKNFVKKGTVGKSDVTLFKVPANQHNPQCAHESFETPGFANICDWYHRAFVTMLGFTDVDGEQEIILRGLNHGYVVKSEYDVTTIWHILVKD